MADLDSHVACTNAYSDVEEDFFRIGEAMSSGTVAEPIAAEITQPVRTKSLWSRLFERPMRLPTEDLIELAPPPVPARKRPPTERPASEEGGDDEWDWMLAVARARTRHATSPGI